MKENHERPVGVIGAGNFGKAVANIIAKNREVLLYTRKEEKAALINSVHEIDGVRLDSKVRATTDLAGLAARCRTILPIVPSRRFREMMRDLSPHLTPAHFIIHGTKGFALNKIKEEDLEFITVKRENVSLMSEVVRQESCVVRIGCISGPNLASEILAGKPAGSVVASGFNEVLEEAKEVLASKVFRIFTSSDIVGTELAGALKNIIAILSGILAGKDLGMNLQALVITKGLGEMVRFGKMMGADTMAFMGTAGIGDLIATALSPDSRNYKFGFRLGRGETVEEVRASTNELVEGLRTLIIVNHLSRSKKLRLPIMQMLYRAIYRNYSLDEAIEYLLSYPYDTDVNYLD